MHLLFRSCGRNRFRVSRLVGWVSRLVALHLPICHFWSFTLLGLPNSYTFGLVWFGWFAPFGPSKPSKPKPSKPCFCPAGRAGHHVDGLPPGSGGPDLGAPNPGIGPHWSSRSGPPDDDCQISDLPGRRGLDRSTPNIGSQTSEVWESKCRIRDIGTPMSGYEVVELCPAVTIDHRAWQPNYGQIWGRQYWRQHLVIQATRPEPRERNTTGAEASRPKPRERNTTGAECAEASVIAIQRHKLHVNDQKLSSS